MSASRTWIPYPSKPFAFEFFDIEAEFLHLDAQLRLDVQVLIANCATEIELRNARPPWPRLTRSLVGADLSPAENALHTAKRKEVYERIHPETKAGAAQELGSSAPMAAN